jgi:hypothetical protein
LRGSGEVLGIRDALLHQTNSLWLRASDQHVTRAVQQRLRNSDHFFRGLALAENHFRHAVAQRAVVVHFGESEILERHVAQPIHRPVHLD